MQTHKNLNTHNQKTRILTWIYIEAQQYITTFTYSHTYTHKHTKINKNLQSLTNIYTPTLTKKIIHTTKHTNIQHTK